MDFERFKQYAAEQFVGDQDDPRSAMSEEAQAFIDYERQEDLDSRMPSVQTQTDPAERGEPELQDTSDESVTAPEQTAGQDSEPEPATQAEPQDAAPADVFTEVALGDALQASSEISVPDPSEAPPAEPEEPEQQDNPPAEFLQPVQEDTPTAATNEQLTDEGVQVDSILNERNDTTWLVPENMDYFQDALREFDRDYSAPVPAGDDFGEIPRRQETADQDPMQATTEFAMQMISGFSQDLLAQERNKP